MRIYRNDLKPDLQITCYDDTTPVDLSTATSIKAIGVKDDVVLFARAITGPYSAAGVVTMLWQAGDTDEAGTIVVEVEVTWPGSKVQTFRPDDFVTVVPDLG